MLHFTLSLTMALVNGQRFNSEEREELYQSRRQNMQLIDQQLSLVLSKNK